MTAYEVYMLLGIARTTDAAPRSRPYPANCCPKGLNRTRIVGRSSGSMQASLEDMANDVAKVIKHLAEANTAVLGHFFGNGVARLLIAESDRLVDVKIKAGGYSRASNTFSVLGD